MKAVMAHVPSDILEARRQTGADRWDEMWEGVIHMPPMPNRTHQDLEGELETWLRVFWARPHGNKVYHQINVAAPGGWPEKNYRIPDIVLLTPERFSIDKNEFFEGGPTVVIEIRSPDDETYEKFPFYSSLDVQEIWVFDRDTRAPEVYALESGRYVKQEADHNGWLESQATKIRLRQAGSAKVTLKFAEDESTNRTLPED